jgi:hypothetical protein
VVTATPDRKTAFIQIALKPAAHLDRLEEVLVLLSRQELEMKKQTGENTAPVASPAAPVKAPASAQ